MMASPANLRPYVCYVLRSTVYEPPRGRTYVGITKSLAKRLRQHNGEISGGARATRSGQPWEVVCAVEGFPDKSTAMKFEWRMHRRNPIRLRPPNPVLARLLNLERVLAMERWTSRSPLAAEVPLRLVWHAADCRPEHFSLPSQVTTE